jgi:predicted nucleotidyltransferase
MMKQWPEFDSKGDLSAGIHQATLAEVLQHFGTGTLQRRVVAHRLERIYNLARSTGQVARFIVFGSFVTAKPDPNDVDIFLLMEDTFDASQVGGEAAIIFDHLVAQNVEGASIFWIRRAAAIGGEQAALEHWQIKRDKTKRGIVEVIGDDQE